MASKMGRRKAAGTRGQKTPKDVSTIIDVLSILMVVTLSADNEAARWQSLHDGCAAASAARYIGGVETGEEAITEATSAELAAKVGTEDPEGAFTSILPFVAILMPPVRGERCPSDWSEEDAAWVPLAGLERVSSTTLDWPAM
jgi:hypothetical protein